MHPISGLTCEICGESLPGLQRLLEIRTCSACRETRPSFAKAAAYGAYKGELRELIHLLKYERVGPAANVLGGMLAEAIGKLDVPDTPVLVIPVPLHRAKRRERRFNQAELIARAAIRCTRAISPRKTFFTAKYTKAHEESTPRFQLATDVLLRERATVSQVGLTRPQRRENIRGAFRVTHLSRVAGCTVLLVDDVLTTGTTASECARVMLKAGAKEVLVATVARTLKETDANPAIAPELADTVQAS